MTNKLDIPIIVNETHKKYIILNKKNNKNIKLDDLCI